MFLGIDPSLTNTGYCVFDPTQTQDQQIIELGLFQTPENMLEILRYEYIAEGIQKLIKKYQITRAGSEGPIFGCTQSENLFALYSHIKKVFYKNKVDVVYFAPVQLKMLAKQDPLKKIKMTKTDMINAMTRDLGLKKASLNGQKISGDMADAYHVAYYAFRYWEFYDQKISDKNLTAAEYKAFAYQHIFKRGLKAGKINPNERGIIFKENELFFRFSNQKPFKKIKGIHKKL